MKLATSLASDRCWVVAEIGVNHNGDPALARALVLAASRAGADAVKIQVRTPELHADPTRMRESAAFAPGALVSELDHRRALELSDTWLEELQNVATGEGLEFFASCWDPPAVERFATICAPDVWKVASATLTDHETLRAIAGQRGSVIMSTGMSPWPVIDAAVERFAGRTVDEDLVLLHTCSEYPSENADVNLRTMEALRRRYSVPVGYSGHERGASAIACAAVALGARVIERHLTLDRSMRGSDQGASLEPQGFAQMVRDVRVVEAAMGDGVKRVTDGERRVAERLRRRLTS